MYAVIAVCEFEWMVLWEEFFLYKLFEWLLLFIFLKERAISIDLLSLSGKRYFAAWKVTLKPHPKSLLVSSVNLNIFQTKWGYLCKCVYCCPFKKRFAVVGSIRQESSLTSDSFSVLCFHNMIIGQRAWVIQKIPAESQLARNRAKQFPKTASHIWPSCRSDQ